MRATLLSLTIASALCSAPQTRNESPTISRDSSRPYIDIVFERFGRRPPVSPAEGDQGLWLRLRNNSILPVEVGTIPNRPGNEILLRHDVVEVAQGPASLLRKVPVLPKPSGYSGIDVFNSREIAPGGDLVFSVPLAHVTRAWLIRVEVFLIHPVIARGIQPRTFVEFDWSALPAEVRRASDQLLYGMSR